MSGEPRRARCTEAQDAPSGGSDTLWALLMLLLLGPLGAIVLLLTPPDRELREHQRRRIERALRRRAGKRVLMADRAGRDVTPRLQRRALRIVRRRTRPSAGFEFPWGTTLLGLVLPLEVLSALTVQTWLESRRLRRRHAA